MQIRAVFEQIGGMETLRRLAAAFYERIEQDPTLRPLFPEDLTAPRERQALFLAQLFGGPPEYKQRGRCSLEQRHASFRANPAQVRAWVRHMAAAMDEVGIAEPARRVMRDYFDAVAPTLIDPLWELAELALPEMQLRLAEDPTLAERRGRHGGTLLHVAAGEWDLERAELLLAAGADVNAREMLAHTPLYRAADRYVLPEQRLPQGGHAITELLIRHGADVNAAGGAKLVTPLHAAARRENLAVARALLDAGADVDAPDRKGETPLRRAVNCGHVRMAALLLERGADPSRRDRKARSPQQAARSAEMRGLLRQHGAAE